MSWKIVGVDNNNIRRPYICECDCGNRTNKGKSELHTSKSCRSCSQIARKGKYLKEYKYVPSTYLALIKANAKDRNLEFDLTLSYLDDLLEAQNFTCILSGVELTIPNKLKAYSTYNGIDRKSFTISLDRIDSTKGYIIGNVQFVHKTINIMKQALTDAAFISLCKIVSDHNFSKETMNIDEIYNSTNYGKTIR